MGEHLLEKRYLLHRGLNPKEADITRPMEFASGMRNAQYTSRGAPEKRKGYQGHGSSIGGMGLFYYNRIDPDSEQVAAEVLAVDSTLYALLESTFTVNYAGASAACQLSFYYDSDDEEYKLQLDEAGVTIASISCGLGMDETSPVTLGDLKTAVDAITGFSAVITGNASTPAAFLKIVRAYDLADSDWEGIAKYWNPVNTTVSAPLSTFYSKRNEADFENASAVVINNVLYIATGYEDLHKYDGQTFYKAGLPTPTSISTADGGAGSITGTNYVHKMQYIQYDAAGQIHEGNTLNSSALSSVTSKKINVTVGNIQATTGYNTNCAIVAGAQTTVNTITVDNGSGGSHTMQAGDTAYFYDSVSGAHVEREVTAVTSTTITIAGNAVTVADNAVISNNLRIAIWRNKTSAVTPTIFYLVAEIPNNSFASTQVYSDDLSDANLGALFIPALSDRSPPPRGKYVTSFQNHLVVAGNLTYPRRLFWSDLDGPEYFPADTNQENIETAQGSNISGIGSGGSVLGIFSKGCHILSGTLGDNNIRIEEKASDIDCVAHASIMQIKGVLCWWSSRGPYAMVNGQLPTPIGLASDAAGNNVGRLEPVMQQDGLIPQEKWKTKRIVALNWIPNKKAIWFIPAETESPDGDIYPNSNSRLYVYDYDLDAWLEWDNINMAGGAVLYNDELFFQERRYSDFEEGMTYYLYRFHNANDAWDYEDNNQPINWQYDLSWESVNQPSVLKRFIELKVFCLEEIPNNEFSFTVNQEMNYQKDASVAQFDMTFSGIGYGTSEYGNSQYGDIAEAAVRHDLKRERTKSMRIRFSNSEHHQNCLISGVEYLIALPYRPEFKR